MERIKTQTVAAPTAGGTDVLEFNVPAHLARWALNVIPHHAGGGAPTVSVGVKYWDGETFRTPNPTLSLASLEKGDLGSLEGGLATRIQVTLTNSDPAMDEGIDVVLLGVRQGQ